LVIARLHKTSGWKFKHKKYQKTRVPVMEVTRTFREKAILRLSSNDISKENRAKIPTFFSSTLSREPSIIRLDLPRKKCNLHSKATSLYKLNHHSSITNPFRSTHENFFVMYFESFQCLINDPIFFHF
jgi:hypothetical protein